VSGLVYCLIWFPQNNTMFHKLSKFLSLCVKVGRLVAALSLVSRVESTFTYEAQKSTVISLCSTEIGSNSYIMYRECE